MNWEIILLSAIAIPFLIFTAINSSRKLDRENEMKRIENQIKSGDPDVIIELAKTDEIRLKWPKEILFSMVYKSVAFDECTQFYKNYVCRSVFGKDRNKLVCEWSDLLTEKDDFLQALKILQLIPQEDIKEDSKYNDFLVQRKVAECFLKLNKPDLALSAINLVWTGRKPMIAEAMPLMELKYRSELALGENKKAKITIQKILTFKYDPELDEILKSI